MQFVRMPSLAENVTEATIAEWLVQEGDDVEEGGSLAEIITEKAEFTLEYEYGVPGEVVALLATEKSVLPVGYILLCVGEKSDRASIEKAAAENEKLLARVNSGIDTDDDGGGVAFGGKAFAPRVGGKIRATPAARRMAKEAGLNLADIAEDLKVKGPVREEHIKRFLEGGE